MQKKLKKYGYLTLSITILVFTIFLTTGAIPRDTHVFEEEVAITAHLWSSDGTKLAYLKSSYRENGELWVAELKTQVGVSPYSRRSAMSSNIRNHQLIYTGVMAGGLLDWQGDWILFVLENETLLPSAYHGIRELWKIKDDGSELTQITFTMTNGIRTTWGNSAYNNIGTTSWGKFIPGTDLVYFSAHNGNGWYRPIVCNADGTDGWYHVSSSPYLYSFTIGMSPTGNKLLWGHAAYWNRATIGLMASNVAQGSSNVRIGSFSYRTTPLVLADGNTVIYQYIYTRPPVGEPPASVRGNIYAMDIDGNPLPTVLDDEYYNRWANYNPVDGQALLMTSDRDPDGNTHIFSINVDGTGMEQLTEGPYNDRGPIYSPDGQYLMYLRLPEDYVPSTVYPDPYELVVMRFSGKQWWRVF